MVKVLDGKLRGELKSCLLNAKNTRIIIISFVIIVIKDIIILK